MTVANVLEIFATAYKKEEGRLDRGQQFVRFFKFHFWGLPAAMRVKFYTHVYLSTLDIPSSLSLFLRSSFEG